ncbi:hypothetical protein [Streptomyces sp. TBY4]|uniref:hypothetical protein n=1 Tax=Streptomyces sp. TBY4 TaxID=2962030 RepID=UPI0020B747E0|nr:hypothetical protein [Streptomyces sp. TBY4]MCP3754782.1 hypothetical protein [Streptomyces sp. TBY4]
MGLATAGLAALASAPAHAAAGDCSLAGCSITYNYSGISATAVRDWTCDSGTTGTSSTGCVSLSYTEWLSNGERTPGRSDDRGGDWDAFRVDAGWCYLVELHAPGKKWHMRYDRRGSSTPVYVKVEDYGTAYIRGQSTTSCP